MLELRAGRTTEDADQEKQANENVAQKATMISEKAEGFDPSAFGIFNPINLYEKDQLTNMRKNDVDNE